MNFKAGISVIMPVYNGEKYIQRAMDSVLNQTHPVQEILIVDDGSKDNTLEKLKSYDSNEKVKLYSQRNLGTGCARNICLLNASCRYLAFLDSDDEWQVNHIEESLKAFNQFKTGGMTVSKYTLNDVSGKIKNDDLEIKLKRRDFILENNLVKYDGYGDCYFTEASKIYGPCLEQKFGFHMSSLIVDRERVPGQFWFDRELRVLQDVDYLLQHLSAGVPLIFINKSTTIYHIHDTNTIMVGGFDRNILIKKIKRTLPFEFKKLARCEDLIQFDTVLSDISNRYWNIAIAFEEMEDLVSAREYYNYSYKMLPRNEIRRHLWLYKILGINGKKWINQKVKKIKNWVHRLPEALKT